MGLFNLFSKKSTQPSPPYKEDSINKIYDLLFCDNIDLVKSETKSSIYPWGTLLSDKPDIDELKAITIDKSIDCLEQPNIVSVEFDIAQTSKAFRCLINFF